MLELTPIKYRWTARRLKWPTKNWGSEMNQLEDEGWEIFDTSVDPGSDGGLIVIARKPCEPSE